MQVKLLELMQLTRDTLITREEDLGRELRAGTVLDGLPATDVGLRA